METVEFRIGRYGRFHDCEGVLVDHADTEGDEIIDADGQIWPVLCGDIIETVTEDGPSDGRCGIQVVPGRFACEGHADERDSWRQMSEEEKVYMEMRDEGYA